MSEKKRILDWFLSHDDMPAELRDKMHLWLLENSGDPEVQRYLHEHEDALPAENKVDISGMMRLKKSLSRSSKPRRIVLRVAATAAVIVALITGGFFFLKKDITPQETIITADTGVRNYTLPDGSTVRLSPGSSLSYSKQGSFREARLDGTAHFDITPDAAHPFRVHFADGAMAEVLGTSFSAESNGALQAIVLRTGSVRISLPTLSESVVLHSDQRLSVEGKAVRIDPVNAASVCRWTEETLTFDATPLGELLECLSYRYNVRIDNRSGVPPDKLISMTVGSESLGEVMSLLGALLSVRPDIQARNVIIY